MNTLTVKKLGKATVIVDIVDKGNPEIRPGYKMNPTEIAIHNTGNKGNGANAKAHNTYIHNMAKLTPKDTGYASWQYSVDAYFIYQHIPIDESAWHTGDGSGLTSGNRTAIGIEICENSDMTDEEYAQAEENAIALAVHLMKLFNIPIRKVKPHQAYSGKYCPRVILNRDGSFIPFRNRIEKAFNLKEVEEMVNYLQRGDTGAAVKVMQENLVKAGLKITVDSSYGPATESAVKSFQSANGLVVDGVYGQKSKLKLESLLKINTAFLENSISVNLDDNLFNTGLTSLNSEFIEMLVNAREKGILKSKEWEDKAIKGVLTESEAIALTGIIVKRVF